MESPKPIVTMRRIYALALAALIVLVAFLAGAQQPAADAAGTIVRAEGDARITPKAGAARAARVGEPVNEGDTIETAQGEVHLRLQDTTFVVLRPKSRFQIAAYKAEGGDDDRSVFQILGGAARMITGWIGKYKPKETQVRTPTITIGIRGTDHETRVIPEGSPEGEAGTYERVFAGETTMQGSDGEVAVKPNQAGFHPQRARQRPRVLGAIPAFFRPGPHEDEINKRHEEIQRDIDRLREERRKLVAQRFAEFRAARTAAVETRRENIGAAKAAKADAQVQHDKFQAERDALERDARAAQALHEEIEAKRKSLEEDAKAGSARPRELAERRRELRQKEAQLVKMRADIAQRRKALGESVTEAKDERKDAARERVQNFQDKRLEAQEKGKAAKDELEAAKKDVKGLRQEEGKRYREELKADRQGTAPTQ